MGRFDSTEPRCVGTPAGNHAFCRKLAGFECWMADVDRWIGRVCLGVSYLDLPDQPYRDWYDSGTRATVAAARALREAGIR